MSAGPRRGERVPELDGVRGVAVSLVVLLHWFVRPHADQLSAWSPRLFALLDFSWCGVDIFFVLSGFLIGGILFDHAAASNLFSTFYLRRACRILPAYLLLLAVASVPLPGGSILGAGEIPLYAYLSFLQNLWSSAGYLVHPAIAPCWSLAIEEQFYLALPLLLLIVFRRRFASLAILMLAVPPLLRALLLPLGILSPWDFTPCRIDAPFWGVLVAALVRRPDLVAFLRRHARWLRAAALTGLVAVACESQLALHRAGKGMMMTAGMSLLGAAFATALLALLFSPQSTAAAALRSPPLVWLGRRSYFIYLFHIVVIAGLSIARPGWPEVVRIPLAAAIVAALATASWRWIEAPMLRIGAGVRYAEQPAVAVAKLEPT